MEPGPEQILECPKCRALVMVSTLASGNTFGAKWWTDGKMEAPMMREQPAITECSGCGDFYWLSDAKVVGEYEFGDSPPEKNKVFDLWIRATRVFEMTEEMLSEAISEGAAQNRDQELYLRMRLWWAGNDPFRSVHERDISPESQETAALKKMQEQISDLLQKLRKESTRRKIRVLKNVLEAEKWETGYLTRWAKEDLKKSLEINLQHQFKLNDQWTKLKRRALEMLIRLLGEEDPRKRKRMIKTDLLKEQEIKRTIKRDIAVTLDILDEALRILAGYFYTADVLDKFENVVDLFESKINDNSAHSLPPEPSVEASKNLAKLMDLLDENKPHERILKAEVARELGRFDEAISILEFSFPTELETTAAFIKKLVGEGDSMVREIAT